MVDPMVNERFNRSVNRLVRALLLALVIGPSWVIHASAGELVPYTRGGEPGSIVIVTKERRLYLVQRGGTALRYTVAVGRPDKQWFGTVQVDGMYIDPAWSPPDEIRQANPSLPDVIPGGSLRNPMGSRALTLSGGGQYAIHGTNRPETVGTFASYGCFRMNNHDVIDLFERVQVGTVVVVRK